MTIGSNTIQRAVQRAICFSAVGVLWTGLLLDVSLAWGQPGSQGPPPALVRVGRVRTETLRVRRDVVGRLEEVRRAVVAAEQPGRVVAVEVEEGDAVVEQTTVLVRVDDIWAQIALKTAEAELAQATARVAEAQAQFEAAKRDREYLDGLFEAGSAKPKEVADSHTTQAQRHAILDRVKAERVAAEATVSERQEQLARLTIVAPFDGVLVRKMIEVGGWVNQGDRVAEIISRGQVDAVVDVPEAVVNQIEIGSEVEILIEPLGVSAAGQVVVINPSGSVVARTFPVKIRLDDRGGELKPAMSVLARIPTSREAAVMTVPRDAVHRSASGKIVWAQLDGVAVPIAVDVLFAKADRFAVRPARGQADPNGSRLTDGTRVVVEGAERLNPNQPLRIAPEGHGG